MDNLDTSNGRLARVLADIEQLITWAQSDLESSRENNAAEQAADDWQRVLALRTAKRVLEVCKR